MGEIKNVATLTDDVQANINRSAIEFRASWMALIYDELKKDGTVRITKQPAQILMTAGILQTYF